MAKFVQVRADENGVYDVVGDDYGELPNESVIERGEKFVRGDVGGRYFEVNLPIFFHDGKEWITAEDFDRELT